MTTRSLRTRKHQKPTYIMLAILIVLATIPLMSITVGGIGHHGHVVGGTHTTSGDPRLLDVGHQPIESVQLTVTEMNDCVHVENVSESNITYTIQQCMLGTVRTGERTVYWMAWIGPTNEEQVIGVETSLFLDFAWVIWVLYVVGVMLIRQEGVRLLAGLVGLGILVLPLEDPWGYILGVAQIAFIAYLVHSYMEK